MSAAPPSDWREALREGPTAHLLLVIAVSAAFESVFFHHGMNVVDEGWPLYAAMGLHEGGVLYRDVFWVFPPGHLLCAWLAYALEPPGLLMARAFYSAFSVALCAGLYGMGRRLMPPGWALFAALLAAVGAPGSHIQQLLFGYRYLVLSLLALFAFAAWQRQRRPAWLFVAGVATGVALAFRLTPAFAAACAIGVGIVASGGGLRDWLRAGLTYAAGLLLVVVPLVGWFTWSVGLETFWLEAVVRPVEMTRLQSLPMPPLTWLPERFNRPKTHWWWVAIQFRAWTLLYAGYVLALAWLWLRALRRREPFAHTLLLVVALWGGIYFVRSFGRSDPAHLYSALPPVCLLIGHGLWLATRRIAEVGHRRVVVGAVATVVMGSWIFLMGSDRYLSDPVRGDTPLAIFDDQVKLRRTAWTRAIDRVVPAIQQLSGPDDVVLDMSASPLLLVVSQRMGPGGRDMLMPGTFANADEEVAFVTRLALRPPAVVIWPGKSFDGMAERDITKVAPRVSAWVRRHYRRQGGSNRWMLMVPKERPASAG